MLIGALELDGKPAKKSLEELNQNFEGALAKFSKFGKLAAGGFVLTEAIEKVMHGFEGVLEMGSRLQSMHLATGESVHDLYIFEKALKRAGGNAEAAQGFIFRLQNAIAGMNEDNVKTADSFALLGTSAQALKNMPLLEQVATLQKGFAGLATQADKVAVVKNLFGFRSASSALPLLTNSDALKGAMASSEKMASLMERNAHAFHDLEMAIGSVKGNLTEFMAGALEVLAPNATDLARALGGIDFTGFGRSAGQFLNVMLQLGRVLIGLGPIIQMVGDKLEQLTSSDMSVAAGAGVGAVLGGPIGALLGGATGWLLGGGDKKKEAPHERWAETFRGIGDSSPKEVKLAPASALQRIGGGGGFGGADPILTEARRHTAELVGIRKGIESFRPHAYMPPHLPPPV